ncbi:MAG: hypothetical protein IKW76_01745 [Clostridia bacterium]|nr:hypothetical protein [Clostridia bacterium]
MKRVLLILLTLLTILAVAACGKKPAKDTNAVLTDSNIPLEVGAEVWEEDSLTQTDADNA